MLETLDARPAQARGHLAVRQGAHVRFAKTSRILAGGHADRTWEKRIRELVRPDVLILDDFAMRQLSAAQADDLYEFVSERQGRSLIITSNRAPSDWYPLFPNPVVAESLLDRLINTSHQVIMNGPSYRPNKRPRTPAAHPSTSWDRSLAAYEKVIRMAESWIFSDGTVPASPAAALAVLRERIDAGQLETWLTSSHGRSLAVIIDR
ncbi:ATP-binding protein [Streptomyces flavofungini]|nr:ATP-binding protein [Streptomyces flavofungini]WJV48394.1 ATP-binding protein [Streptomyces flavofungini]